MQKKSISTQPFPHAQISWPVQNVQAFTSLRNFEDCNQHAWKKYQTFNLGLHVGDDPQSVNLNRTLLAENLPQNTKIQWLDQVHGSTVAHIKQCSESPIVADAAFTDEKGIALAVMTADCLPILLSSIDGKYVAAIHGGWRCLAGNIIDNTVSLFPEPSSIVAWLGPCVGPTAFEVGEDVREAFTSSSALFEKAFLPHSVSDNKYFADLHQIARAQLAQLGVKQVYSKPDCTFSEPSLYFSYRRDGQTGRMATVICRY
ncbi:peptidoglycan editing factor PgeF [Thalassotalea euphylliae]|uniref:peptidoglycan editing factor PgeF n=1 Tax=Thalassotalea euphylliae TaxID=1655234 RepID=UPI00364586B6